MQDPTDTLSGSWSPIAAELGGQPLPIAAFRGAQLRLSANTYEFADDRGTYALVGSASSSQMDIHGVSGPNAGKLIQAIFELGGDDLVIAYQLGPDNRPTDFSSPAGTQILVIRYVRSGSTPRGA